MLELRGDIVSLVANATPPAFGAMQFAVRERRAALQRKPTTGRLTSLVLAVHDWLDVASRGEQILWALGRAGLATAAAFLSSALFTTSDGILSVVVATAVLVVTMPWEDIYTTLILLRVKPQARVKLFAEAAHQRRGSARATRG